MDKDEMNFPMGGSNRVNKNYKVHKQASPSHGAPSHNQYSKYNHNPNLKSNNMTDQQFFNNFQNGFLRSATNLNLGNLCATKDEPENELLSLVLKTPDQSKALLNIFIKDFLDKSGMSKTGRIFEMEHGGEIKEDHDFLIDIERKSIKDALEIKRSFLNEWWQIFWDAFNAKAHKNGSKIAQEYYSFNISRKNLDFLCRQASMKAAFEQQILERKGEYQREAMNQQTGNPFGFNSFFGCGYENFPSTNPNQQKGNTPQPPNSRSNEFQKSPSHQEAYDGMGLNNADIMYKLKEQQQLQQHRQWKSETEYNNIRQGYAYNSAQGSPENHAAKNDESVDENENMIGHDAGEYGFANPNRNNTGKRRRSLQTQQMVQLRLNKITPLVKQNEYPTMANVMGMKNGNSSATTPMSNVHSYQTGSVSSHTNDVYNGVNNGQVPYLTAYDEQLMSMEQRLANNRIKKNSSTSNNK